MKTLRTLFVVAAVGLAVAAVFGMMNARAADIGPTPDFGYVFAEPAKPDYWTGPGFIIGGAYTHSSYDFDVGQVGNSNTAYGGAGCVGSKYDWRLGNTSIVWGVRGYGCVTDFKIYDEWRVGDDEYQATLEAGVYGAIEAAVGFVAWDRLKLSALGGVGKGTFTVSSYEATPTEYYGASYNQNPWFWSAGAELDFRAWRGLHLIGQIRYIDQIGDPFDVPGYDFQTSLSGWVPSGFLEVKF